MAAKQATEGRERMAEKNKGCCALKAMFGLPFSREMLLFSTGYCTSSLVPHLEFNMFWLKHVRKLRAEGDLLVHLTAVREEKGYLIYCTGIESAYVYSLIVPVVGGILGIISALMRMRTFRCKKMLFLEVIVISLFIATRALYSFPIVRLLNLSSRLDSERPFLIPESVLSRNFVTIAIFETAEFAFLIMILLIEFSIGICMMCTHKQQTTKEKKTN